MATLEADPSYDLVTLNVFISQQEGYLRGPLTSIGNSGGFTTLVINTMAGIPTKNSVVTVGAVPAGSRTIGSGQIYISGHLTAATAYSPT